MAGRKHQKEKCKTGRVEFKCDKCEEEEQAVECDLCSKWICWSCSRIEETDVQHVKATESVMGLIWLCEECNTETRTKKDIVKDLRVQMIAELAAHRETLEKETGVHKYKEEATIAKQHLSEVEKENENFKREIEMIKLERDTVTESKRLINDAKQTLNEELNKNKKICEELKDTLNKREEIGGNGEDIKNLEETVNEMKKKYETQIKKKEKENNSLREEVSQYKIKISTISEEESYQKSVNKILIEQVETAKKMHSKLELALERATRSAPPAESINAHEERQNRRDIREQQNRNENAEVQQQHENNDNTEKVEQDSSIPVCNAYAYWKPCRFGPRCLYVHQRICKKFAGEGKCLYGNRCHYSHDIRNKCRQEETEGGCRYGERCRFGHINKNKTQQVENTPRNRMRTNMSEIQPIRDTSNQDSRETKWEYEMTKMRREMTNQFKAEMSNQISFLVQRVVEQNRQKPDIEQQPGMTAQLGTTQQQYTARQVQETNQTMNAQQQQQVQYQQQINNQQNAQQLQTQGAVQVPGHDPQYTYYTHTQ